MTFHYRWNFIYLILVLLCMPSACYGIEQPIEGIDAIYLINLDHRSDRLARTQNALSPYGIFPTRFPAVNGRKISLETLNKIALPCGYEASQQRWMTRPLEDGTLGYTLLSRSNSPQPIFCEWMSIGAVGCAMSHLSVLREAYDKGCETIWVLEDDILVCQDPRALAELINRLDLITEGEWDLLYTDSDDLCENNWLMWRPDLAPTGDVRFSMSERIDEDFVRLASRTRTHSMIIRRSGMKKILDHFEQNHLFLPFDHEIAFAPGIILYMLSYPLVTYNRTEDTDIQKTEPFTSSDTSGPWAESKKNILRRSSLFCGWCSEEKATCLMDFIYHHRPKLCVEIGAFGGSTSYPITSALAFLGQGHLYAIDAWRCEEAVQGLGVHDPNYIWWSKLDFKVVKENFTKQLNHLGLCSWCTLVHKPSLQAVDAFADGSIDLLYIDGNFSAKGSLADVITYFPKVKPGGYIWLNDANALEKRSSIAFLAEHAEFIPKESLRNCCVVFQKAPLDR